MLIQAGLTKMKGNISQSFQCIGDYYKLIADWLSKNLLCLFTCCKDSLCCRTWKKVTIGAFFSIYISDWLFFSDRFDMHIYYLLCETSHYAQSKGVHVDSSPKSVQNKCKAGTSYRNMVTFNLIMMCCGLLVNTKMQKCLYNICNLKTKQAYIF